ncbi:MAG: alpha/beta hydrolase [Azoarcus sp.]|jgi:pimeloyl-ACP methyl ester carboxylesterase|nr:alpha/beta hydrolase [Azoarcus sp.]
MKLFLTLPPNDVRPRALTLEFAWFGPENVPADAPTLVFLHEGLGCVDLWRDFPQALCERLQCRGLAYSRFAYGQSTPRPHDEAFPVDYLEREAEDVLPAVLVTLDIKRPWLIGHSDGGTIALLAAASDPECALYSGIVVIAPHYWVEELCVAGIERARIAYEEGELRRRLAKYHQDADSAFYGWCHAWLDATRRGWNIEASLKDIACPTLAIQGVQDEYASLDQIEAIQRHAPQTKLMKVDDCGHFPFLDRPEVVIDAVVAFVRDHRK